jgi:hypothetical protein
LALEMVPDKELELAQELALEVVPDKELAVVLE